MEKSTLPLITFLVFSAPIAAQNPSAIAFDGVDDYVDAGASSVFNIIGELTLEAWVKVDPVQNNPFPRIIDKFDLIEQEGYNLIANGGHLFMEVFDTNGDSYNAYGSSIDDGLWHHVAGVFTGTSIQLYIDGLPDIGETFPPIIIQSSSYNLSIGNSWDGQSYLPLHGSIDEVRIWDVARSGAEILARKDSCIAPSTPGLVGYWRFDENSGLIAGDLTANGNDADLGNGAAWSTDVAYPALGDCSISGITSIEDTPGLEIAPNPVTDESVVIFDGVVADGRTIEIHDHLGRLRMVASKTAAERLAIRKTDFEAGVYVLTATMSGGNKVSARFVVL